MSQPVKIQMWSDGVYIVRLDDAAIPRYMTGPEVFERLRSAPGETEPSVPTRTSEHGLSYHDETEALREALEEIDALGPPAAVNWREWVAKIRGIARRALSQHVGGEG